VDVEDVSAAAAVESVAESQPSDAVVFKPFYTAPVNSIPESTAVVNRKTRIFRDLAVIMAPPA
jgi:hypothetical protein